MCAGGFATWVRRFEDERERRQAQGDPDWGRGATLHPAVWASVQRFQVGEDGDGANLVGKADHGPALRRLGIGRLRFMADVVASAGEVVSAVLAPHPMVTDLHSVVSYRADGPRDPQSPRSGYRANSRPKSL